MADDALMVDEIEVAVSGVFTTHHYFRSAMGDLGELTLHAFRSGGAFVGVDGQSLMVQKTSWWRGEHEMHKGSVLLATAHPRGFFRTEIAVRYNGQQYMLERLGVLNRGWRLIDETRMPLLEVQPRGIFRQGAYLRILNPLDKDLLIFAYYLIHVRWQEEAGAAAAAGAGS